MGLNHGRHDCDKWKCFKLALGLLWVYYTPCIKKEKTRKKPNSFFVAMFISNWLGLEQEPSVLAQSSVFKKKKKKENKKIK